MTEKCPKCGSEMRIDFWKDVNHSTKDVETGTYNRYCEKCVSSCEEKVEE